MFVDGCRVVGNLPIQQLRNLTCDPGKPLIAKRRAKKAAEDECHRHRSGTDRKPSTALAVGPDKKNENKNPCSKENQRGPHVTCTIASHTRLRRSRPALLVSRKRVKICLLRPKAKLRLVSAAWFPIGVTSLRMRLTLRVRLTSTIDAAPTFGHGRARLHLSLSSGLLFLSLELVLLTG